jgi:DNA-binding MarR family transcriptional regulator
MPTILANARASRRQTRTPGQYQYADTVASDRVVPLWELVQTAHLASLRFTEVFAAAGLSPAQFGVLASLADGDDLSQADLARAVLVRPQSMGRLISGMVAHGLVSRDGPGGRGRRTQLALTSAGRRALTAARPAAYALDRAATGALDDHQRSALVEYLRVLRRSLGAPDGPEGFAAGRS